MRFGYFLFLASFSLFSCSESADPEPDVEPTTEGLVAYYDFEGDALDKIGTNNAEATNVSYFSANKANSSTAVELSGTTSYLRLTNPFDFENRTISLWLLAREINDVGEIFYSSDNNNILYGLTVFTVKRVDSVPLLYFNISNKIYSTPIVANKWYHITAIAEGMSCRYYLDGTLVYTATFASYIKSGNGDLSATLGCSRVFDRLFTGMIDDLRVYDRALTEDEVEVLARP